MMRGEIDFLYEVNRDAVDFLEAGTSIQTFSFPRPYYISDHFQHQRTRYSADARSRQAINEAIDRGKIVRTALNDRGTTSGRPDLAVSLGLSLGHQHLHLQS